MRTLNTNRQLLAVSLLSWAAAALSGFFPAHGADGAARIPLCPGLTVVGAFHDAKGDYESITRVASVSDDGFTLNMSAQRPKGGSIRHFKASRTVLASDKKNAALWIYWFDPRTPITIPGSTSLGASTAILRALKTKGTAEIKIVDESNSSLSANPNVHPNLYDHQVAYNLQRVGTARIPVTVNGAKIELPAIHARGEYLGDQLEVFFHDDESNPLALRYWFKTAETGTDAKGGQVVKITYRCPDSPAVPGGSSASTASRLEQELVKTGRAEIYDIYFDFNSDRIREESEPTLREIADVLRRHPDWKLSIEGHTDNIGTDAANLDLSKRRAASVKNALAGTYRIAANRFVTTGYGESRPKDRNETIEGRARNRRVELVRQ